MEKKKCGQCGLVNWPGVLECARCGAFVSDKQQAVGRNPYENDPRSGGFNPIKMVAFLGVAAVVGIGAYVAFSVSAPPKPANAPAVVTVSPEEQKKIYEAGVQAWRDDQKRMDDIRNSANVQTAAWGDPTKPGGFKNMEEFKKSVEDCPTRYLQNNPGGGKTCTFPK
jgi:hypothetical protein